MDDLVYDGKWNTACFGNNPWDPSLYNDFNSCVEDYVNLVWYDVAVDSNIWQPGNMNWDALPKDVVKFLNSVRNIPNHCAPAGTDVHYTFNGGNECVLNMLNGANAEHNFAKAIMSPGVSDVARPYYIL